MKMMWFEAVTGCAMLFCAGVHFERNNWSLLALSLFFAMWDFVFALANYHRARRLIAAS